MRFGHKTQSIFFEASQDAFNRLVADGVLAEADWVEPPFPPPHDPATQAVPYWSAGQWVIRQLTADEIAVRNAVLQDDADMLQEREQIRSVVQDLKNGTGTTAQRLTRCEKAIVYLIKRVLA